MNFLKNIIENRKNILVVWSLILLFSGQGIRYLIGIPFYALTCVITISLMFFTFKKSIFDRKTYIHFPVLLLGFIFLAVTSVFWSTAPKITLAATAVLIVLTVTALIIRSNYDDIGLVKILYRGFQVNLFVNIFFELLVSFIIRHPILPLNVSLQKKAGLDVSQIPFWSSNKMLTGGPIEGFVGNRNILASIALMTAIMSLMFFIDKIFNRFDSSATFICAIIVLMLTRSATINITAVCLLILAVGSFILRRTPEKMKEFFSWLFIGLCLTIGVLVIKFRDIVFPLFDRDPDFTNRERIWDLVIHYALQKPEGWGWVTYWPIWDYPYNIINSVEKSHAIHAHNAFLDVWLQLGIIGLILFAVSCFLLSASAWRMAEKSHTGESTIPVIYMLLTAALMLQSFTESRILTEGNWVLLVLLLCSVPPAFKLRLHYHSIKSDSNEDF